MVMALGFTRCRTSRLIAGSMSAERSILQIVRRSWHSAGAGGKRSLADVPDHRLTAQKKGPSCDALRPRKTKPSNDLLPPRAFRAMLSTVTALSTRTCSTSVTLFLRVRPRSVDGDGACRLTVAPAATPRTGTCSTLFAPTCFRKMSLPPLMT